MKKLIVLLVLLLATSISCSQEKSQPQTITAQTSQKETKQLGEYENKILDRAETFYNNRITHILWTMSIIMTVGLAIVGIIIPMLLERQRRINFKKEMKTHLTKSEDELKKYSEKKTEEVKAELTKEISSPLSLAFLGLAGLLSEELSPAAYSFMLQLHVLAMKFDIISQCSGASFTASGIISSLDSTKKGDEIELGALKDIDELVETIKEDIKKIIDEKNRKNMENQVRELQIYIHQLIYKKQQTPPQSSPQ